MTGVYRAPMRSRCDDVDPALAVDRALDAGVCGMGGRLAAAPADLGEALAAVATAYDERAARRLERFADVPVGAFVWTSDGALTFLGRLTGPWRYDASSAAREADLVHVRDCEWLCDPVPSAELPAAVTRTFARGGRNFQQIHDPAVSRESSALWREARAGAQFS